MPLKDKIINTITAHPKMVTFGIGLAITFVIGTVIGMFDHGQLANAVNTGSNTSWSNSQGAVI